MADNDYLLDVAAETRRVLSDPDGIYAKNPDAKVRLENQMAAVLLRAGVKEPVQTPESVAQATHDAAYTLRELHPNVVGIINERTAAIAPQDAARLSDALRAEMGAEVYDRLVKDAGSAATPAVRADRYALQQIANHGRYMARYNATKPGAKR